MTPRSMPFAKSTDGLNLFDQTQIHDRAFHACVAVVASGFPHLGIAAIIEPPHRWFDAALARQIVIHLMVRRYHIPKRRAVLMQGRSREAVNRALRTIDEQVSDDAIAAHYAAVERDAQSLLQLDPSGAA